MPIQTPTPIRGSVHTKSVWEAANPILNLGQQGYEISDGVSVVGSQDIKIKLGDGINQWNELPYIFSPGTYEDEIQAAGSTQTDATPLSKINNAVEVCPTGAGVANELTERKGFTRLVQNLTDEDLAWYPYPGSRFRSLERLYSIDEPFIVPAQTQAKVLCYKDKILTLI